MTDRIELPESPLVGPPLVPPAEAFHFHAFRLHLRPEEEHQRRRMEVMRLLREDPAKLRAADVAVSLRVGNPSMEFTTCPFTDVPDAGGALAARLFLPPRTDVEKLARAVDALEWIARKGRGRTVLRARSRAKAALAEIRMPPELASVTDVDVGFTAWKGVDVNGVPARFDPATDFWLAPSFVELIVMLVRREPEQWVAWRPRGTVE